MLAAQFADRLVCQYIQFRFQFAHQGRVQHLFDGLLAHVRLIRQAHAIGRQHAAQRVRKDGRHAQRIRDQAGMLPARAAKHGQRVFGHIVAALHRDALDGFGHVAHRDLQKALGQLLRRHLAAGGGKHVGGHGGKAFDHGVAVQGLVCLGAKHVREEFGLNLAQQHVAVRDGQRAAAAIARRARIGARGIGPDAQSRAVKMQDGAATGRDGVNAHHGRAHAHAGHLGFEFAFELARIVRHIGGRAAHVKADHLRKACDFAGPNHADDAAGRPGQDRVLAAETVGIGQAAAGLHEHETDAGQFAGHLVHVALQDGRQIRVHHGRVAARDELDQRADLVRHGHLRESDLGGDARGLLLVAGGVPRMHEHNGHRADAAVESRLHVTAKAGFVQRTNHFAVGRHALVRLDDGFVQHLGQQHVAVKEPRAILVGDAQGIAESARGDQQGALALALEQRIGRHRGAHLHALDLVGGHGLSGCDAQQLADAGNGSVAVLLGVFRQHLRRGGRAIGASRHDVGEGAPTVNPELPLHRYPRKQETAAARSAAVGLRMDRGPAPDVGFRERSRPWPPGHTGRTARAACAPVAG